MPTRSCLGRIFGQSSEASTLRSTIAGSVNILHLYWPHTDTGSCISSVRNSYSEIDKGEEIEAKKQGERWIQKCGTNKTERKENRRENRESLRETGRKIEITKKKKRLWKLNIEFKGERYVSDMEQKYSEKIFAILHKKLYKKNCTVATAQNSLCTDFYEVIA